MKLKGEEVAKYEKHVAEYGPPGSHTGCPALGNQCLIKADRLVDYTGDLGFPARAEYEVVEVTKEDLDGLAEKARLEAQAAIKEAKTFWSRE